MNTQPTRTTPPPEGHEPLNVIARLQSGFGLAGIVVVGTYGPEVHVETPAELDAWFGQFRAGYGLSVSGRYETRDGVDYCLGGLDWRVHLKVPGVPLVGNYSLTVRLITAEGEVLPDLPVVRRGWPYDLERAEREAALAAARQARAARLAVAR